MLSKEFPNTHMIHAIKKKFHVETPFRKIGLSLMQDRYKENDIMMKRNKNSQTTVSSGRTSSGCSPTASPTARTTCLIALEAGLSGKLSTKLSP